MMTPTAIATTSTGLKVAKLIMVTARNNNKYYEMQENTDGTFSVKYGRVGSRATSANYPIRLWNSKYKEKIRKGYKDQTHLFAKNGTNKNSVDFEDISDLTTQQFISALMRYAKKSISTNYNVSADQVTLKQVEEAQNILDGLVNKVQLDMNVTQFNATLLELYQVIPRRMNNVIDHLITSPSSAKDLKKIETKLAEEQATLDVMRGQVDLNSSQKNQPNTDSTKINIMQSMGLAIEPVKAQSIINMIKDMMGTDAHKFHQAFKVVNVNTQASYDQFLHKANDKKVELFWHGSRNENWLSILKTGLVLRPANAVITGKMFGYGLYFADKFRKSLNYTSLRGSYWARGSQDKGFLALYDVHVGKQLKIKNHQSWCYDLSEPNLKKHGSKYDSLFAEGGADLINNEYIIYNQAQCTVRYIVEVRG